MTDQVVAIEINDPANLHRIGWDSVAQLKSWLESEANFWQIKAQQAAEIFNKLGSQPGQPFRAEIDRYTRLLSSVSRAGEIPVHDLQDLENELNDRRLLMSGTPIANNLVKLEKSDPEAFAIASVSGQPKSLLRITDPRGGNAVDVPATSLARAALVRFPPSLTEIDAVGSQIERGRTSIEAEQKSLAAAFVELKQQQLNVAALETTYRDELKLHAARQYWARRASDCTLHCRIAFLGFLIGVGLFVNGVIALGGFMIDVFRSAPAESQFASIAMVTLPSLAWFWVLRLIARFYVLNLSRGADAIERATLVETYLALCKDTAVPPTEAERLILFRSISRPGPGDSVEEAPQDAILDQLLSSLRK